VDEASRVFQWVVLVAATVLRLHEQGNNMKMIQKKLQEIPTELDHLHQKILEGIDEDDLSQLLKLMRWICFAQRPLSL
jgi:hypothetical protein